MSEKLKRIEFKGGSRLSNEEIVNLSGFLITRTSVHREAERRRLHHEIVDQGESNGLVLMKRKPKTEEEFEAQLERQNKFSDRVHWLDHYLWKSYYELIGRVTPRDDRLSMTSLNVGFIGIKPVLLEQHWHTDDLDDPGRDYTEFQYMVADPETMKNPPLVDEVKSHLDFVTEGSPVSDSELPRITTFGTIGQEQLRDILPAPNPAPAG